MPPHHEESPCAVAVAAAPTATATTPAQAGVDGRLAATWRALDLRWPLLWSLLGYAGLRLWLLTSTKVNSDEPQHLHVVWAWAQHTLVPYRDVFDNHVPLFHMLLAPWLRWLGETPDVLLWARVLMLPVAFGSVAVAAWLGLRLWGRKVARATVLLLAALSSYALVAGEFRTDALWGLAWTAGIAVLALSPLTARRWWLAGLLFGVALMTSLKTLPLLLALIGAGALVGRQWSRVAPLDARRVVRVVLAWFAGLAVPVLFVLWRVQARGALPAMIDDAWRFNLGVDVVEHAAALRHLLLPLIALQVLLVLRGRVAAATDRALAARRVFVQAVAWFSTAIMLGAWPIVTRQDLLPLLPILAPVLAAWWFARHNGRVLAAVVPAVLAVSLLWTLVTHLPWHSRTASFSDWLGTVLAITRPGEPVLDAKGAAIYRPRPYFPVLETITLQRLHDGALRDGLLAAMRDSQTHVVSTERFTPAALDFVHANYVLLRPDLWVSGQEGRMLAGQRSAAFDLAIGGDYEVLNDRGQRLEDARIDGREVGNGLRLRPGGHVLHLRHAGHYRLLWAPAADWWRRQLGTRHA